MYDRAYDCCLDRDQIEDDDNDDDDYDDNIDDSPYALDNKVAERMLEVVRLDLCLNTSAFHYE
jgi:hypothetical protein